MAESNSAIGDDLQGDVLVQSVLNNEPFVKEVLQGFEQIEAGENTVITLEQLRESLENGQPMCASVSEKRSQALAEEGMVHSQGERGVRGQHGGPAGPLRRTL